MLSINILTTQILLTILLFLASFTITLAAENVAKKPAENTIFHEPFTLKLHIDKEQYYEEKFDKIPFVNDGDVYLFKGDEFGLELDIQDNSIRKERHSKDQHSSGAARTFRF